AEHQRLQTAAQDGNAVVPNAVEESDEMRATKRELARLRNEVHQLRGQKPDLDRLRSENEHLALRIAEISKPRLPPTEEHGFVLRQNWAPAGFASPEAAVLTFFWAVREQDHQTALACITQEQIRSSNLIDSQTQTLRPGAAEGLSRLAQIQGFRVSSLRTNSSDSVRVDVQSNPDGPAITFRLRRIGGEWKIDDF